MAEGIFVCGADFFAVFLYAVVTVEIMQLSYGVFNSLLSILSPLIFSFRRGSASNILGIQWGIASIAFCVSGSGPLIMSVFCYRAIYRHVSLAENRNNRYFLLALIPALMIFLTGGYINSAVYGDTIVMDGSEKIVNTANIANIKHFQMLAIQLLGIASLFCTLYAYQKWMEHFCLSAKLSLMEQEAHFQRRYVEEAKARYEKTKSFRHDVKNHITVVKELLQNGRQEEALRYISDMEQLTEDLSFPCSTNHPVLDILIGNKLGIAKNEGIEAACSLQLPYPCSVHDIDLCIILSNALDNAICACKKMKKGQKRHICVSGSIQGDFVLIRVENSFCGNVSFRQGTGLGNIKTAAEKYHGAMHIKTQGEVFDLSVLLILSQPPKSISRQTGSSADSDGRNKE